MAANSLTNGQKIGQNNGKGSTDTDKLSLFLKVFGGEVLAAFARRSVAMQKFMVRTIQNGKSAQFPVLGRTGAKYLAPGDSLDDQREGIKHTEKVINIDGLLSTDVLIYDIEDAMNHYDVRSEYSAQIGEALAIAADGAILGELAILCNPLAGKNENIAGLGTASVLKVGEKATISASAEPEVALGKAIIAGLTKARAALTKNYVPAADRTFFTTPENYSAILAALMPNSANFAALIDPETGNIRNVMGFEVIEVPHLTQGGADGKHAIPADATTATDVVNLTNIVGLFGHRTAVGTLKLRDMALERARRPEYQADQIIGRYAMGHGGLRPEAAGALVFGK
ncbi:MAG: phage capsid protein [Spirochaetia bacterium]|nr:phage capsid protein [Spirochaetia bacterium]